MDSTTQPDSEVMALFRQWRHLNLNYPPERADPEQDDADMTAHCARALKVAERMMALPSTSAADMAAKLIATTIDGAFFGGDDALIEEARRLTA